MTGTDLVRLSIDQIEHVALRASISGQFGFAKPEQAFMCVLAGQEVGIPPFAAVTGIHVIQGKPVIGAGLLASLVKSSVKYDYRVTKHTAEECVIAFFEHGDHVGDSSYTIEDAKTAGLVKPGPWTQHPRNMLFARAMSNGQSWFAPDVTGGRVYVEGELDEPTPPPLVRDVVATVESVEPEPIAGELVDAATVRATLKSLTPAQREAIRDAFARFDIDLGTTQKSAVEAITQHITSDAWATAIARVTAERFPDDLADLKDPPTSTTLPADRNASLLGENLRDANLGELSGVAAYGEGAAS